MKSKLFSPEHKVPVPNPLGEASPAWFWPEDEKGRFMNAQAVPRFSTFGSNEPDAMPTTPYRTK